MPSVHSFVSAAFLLTATISAEEVPQHLPLAPTLDVPAVTIMPRGQADPDDAAWKHAAVIHLQATEASSMAEIRLLWNPDALWIRCQSQDDHISTPFGETHDAEHYRGDVFELFLDPVGDGRLWYEIQATPGGGITDWLHQVTVAPQSDAQGVLLESVRTRDLWRNLAFTVDGLQVRHAVQRKGDQVSGWIIDMIVPPSVLRRTGADRFTVGAIRANLLRYDWITAADGTVTPRFLAWAPVRPGCPHISPMAMGTLNLMPDTQVHASDVSRQPAEAP